MKLYSYTVTHDSGFAPNPFWDYCTLATCKPDIRLNAQEGDWVIGTGSVKNVGRDKLIYAMQITEVLPLEQYYEDERFQAKRPIFKGSKAHGCGDNMYRKVNDEWKQLPSAYHTYRHRAKDLRGRNALISEIFYYFGRKAVEIPIEFRALTVIRGYKHRHSSETVQGFLLWLNSNFKTGKIGEPSINKSCGCRE
ncbi:MAG: hypothetical protein KKD28_15700 [Chloroflexi bacterium]|nr:hypothetical protein [Chloroflexota bacterium]